ncbi:MAG: hypothetical protein KC933_12240 [Myxococcales bacterium]|nr:hypothetical protein [Myxococcales bacterium]
MAWLAASIVAFASFTNTELVRDVVVLDSGVVVAATSGGVDVFDGRGRPLDTLHTEDGLPSHETYAVRRFGDQVVVATARGLAVMADNGEVSAVGRGRPWHGLPEAKMEEGMQAYLQRLSAWEARWPAAVIPAALAEDGARWAVAMVDGRLEVSLGEHLHRLSVPGMPQAVAFSGSELLIATSEALFGVDAEGRLRPVQHRLTAPFAARAAGAALEGVDATGQAFLLSAAGVRPLERLKLKDITAFAPGRTYLGVREQGVWSKAGRRLTRTGQLCGNHVTRVIQHQGRWVVGTFDRGVCWSSDAVTWRTFRRPALPSDVVYDVASVGARLFVATSHGLGVHDGRRFTHYGFGGRNPFGLEALSVLAVLPAAGPEGRAAVVERRGISWLGDDASLIARERGQTDVSEHFTAAAAAGPYLWLGTEDRGVLRFDGTSWTVFHDGKDLPDNWVTALDAAPDGRAVVGTCQDGVAFIDPGQETLRLGHDQGLADDMVTGVALGEAPRSAFVGTLGGLSQVEGGRVVARFGPEEGLADPRVASVQRFGEVLWVGTEAGLSRALLSAPQASVVSP